MTTTAPTPLRTRLRTEVNGLSWLWLISGGLWIIVSLMILQFNPVSAATVGTIAGVMFLGAGVEYFILGSMMRGVRWLHYLYGGILSAGGVVTLFYPIRTFFAIAIILGYMFAIIGIMWVVEAFLTRNSNDFWWLHLVSGILMMVQGFWLAGQFLLTQAAALLIFAGVWAMMRGLLDITTFLTMRSVADALPKD